MKYSRNYYNLEDLKIKKIDFLPFILKETVVQSVTQITLSLEESVKEMDEVILGMKNFFENFKIENRHFSNKLKVIIFK